MIRILGPRRRRGYTLVELIVVMVLMGTLLAVVTPAFTSIAVQPTGATVVLDALKAARATSLSQAAPVDVIIDPTTARIWLRSDRTSPRLDTTYKLALPSSDTLVARSARARFSFRPDGSVWGDEISIRSGSKSTRVDLDVLSGITVDTAALPRPAQ